jgi:hypothetical protein
MYIDVVMHGLAFPSASTLRRVCLGSHVEAQEQVVTFSFL